MIAILDPAKGLIAALLFGAALIPVVTQTSVEQIKQLERDRQQAFIRGDLTAIARETADDYTTINGTGAISDKPRMMASLASGRTKVLSVSLEDLKARVYDDVAVLTGIYRDISVTEGVEKHVNARFTRVFVRRAGAWQAVSYQQTLLPQ
jgi:ketosteroid isomerase-like protein